MQRVKSETLDRIVDLINKSSARKGKPRLSVHRSRPGDGWTRHFLMEERGGGKGYFIDGAMTHRECYHVLQGILTALEGVCWL